MRVAVDSNVLIYAEGFEDEAKRKKALLALKAPGATDVLLPVQAAAEALRWMVKKGGLTKSAAVARSRQWIEAYNLIDSSGQVFETAATLIATNDFQVFDAIILSAAASANADVLLSEDMQDGFRWRGVTIVNPFAQPPSPLIAKIMNG